MEIDFLFTQKKIAEGDEHAFAKLYNLMGKKLIAFSTSIIHSKSIAEEVVEDVFVNLWLKRQKIIEIDNLPVYLYVSVKNASLNKLSQKSRDLINASYDELDPSVEALKSNPYTILITTEMLGRMNQAIEALPPKCKMIFKLVREDGLRYKEVAEILNISVNTIDVQMAIAVKRICENLHVYKNKSVASKKSLIKKT